MQPDTHDMAAAKKLSGSTMIAKENGVLPHRLPFTYHASFNAKKSGRPIRPTKHFCTCTIHSSTLLLPV